MWYNNHSRYKNLRSDFLLEMSAPPCKKKQLAAYQAYQSLYKQKVSSTVNAEWPDEWRADPERDKNRKDDDPPPPPIQFRNKVAKQLLAAESDEVKAQVEAFRTDKIDKDEEKKAVAELDDSGREAEAKAYQE
jgi:hypothetical protein